MGVTAGRRTASMQWWRQTPIRRTLQTRVGRESHRRPSLPRPPRPLLVSLLLAGKVPLNAFKIFRFGIFLIPHLLLHYLSLLLAIMLLLYFLQLFPTKHIRIH